MTKEESEGFLRGIATVIKEHIEAATAPLRAEIAELKARPVIGLDEVKALIPEPVTVKAFDASVIDGYLKADDAEALVVELIGKHVPTVKGETGEPGKPGENGKDADEDAITARVLAAVEPMVAKAVSAIPAPRDGRDGLPGRDGAPGVDGKDGAPGRDGTDGLGFDDLTIERSGARGILVKFSHGDRVKEFPLTFPVVLDAGVYVEDKDYEPGDGTSHAGCFWIAQEPTRDKPGTSKAWRLAVKKGRDGKGEKGEQGKPGAKGIDGRNYDGSRAY